MPVLSLLARASPQAKQKLREIGRGIGFDIRLNGINSRDDLRFVHFLEIHGVDTVLDVGANVGQFGLQLFKAGYTGRLVSFEPLPQAHATLQNVAAAYPGRWTVGPRVALSDRAGTATFHVTEGSASSSLLKPIETFVEATPQVRVGGEIEVATERLDAIAQDLGLDEGRAFLKLDVQGSEALVLAGAGEALRKVEGVLVELSLVELYAGQSSALSVHQLITSYGLEIWDIWPGYRNPATQRLNQIDALYFRGGAAIASA